MKLLATFAVASATIFAQDWTLGAGSVQLRGFGGGSAGEDTGTGVDPVGGAGIVVGAHPNIGVFADYAYHSPRGFSSLVCDARECVSISRNARLHELMGGVRFAGANSTRVTPYGKIGVGAIAASESAALLGVNIHRDSVVRFMFGGGGGMDFHLSNRVGLNFDVSLFKIPDGVWRGRVTIGVFYRVGGN